MTAAIPIPQAASAQVRRWTTPGTLWRALAALWLCDLLLLLSLVYSGHVHRAGLKTVGRDAAPSIIAAQAIKASLADMDAEAVNELLLDPGAQLEAVHLYNDRRTQAAAALIRAAENITFGDLERKPIMAIQIGMGRYEALIQKARDLRDEHDSRYLAVYNEAAALMDQQILPAADALDTANFAELERAFHGENLQSTSARFVVGFATIAFLGLLVLVQAYLLQRTKRIFNAPLLAATALSLLFIAFAFYSLHNSREDLRRAKEEAFNSIHSIWQGWATAYEANADESRYLLDPSRQREWTEDFNRKRDHVILICRRATSRIPNGAESAPQAFAQYLALDSQIRQLESTGRHKEAIALCTGTKPGQSDWAFNRFSEAMQQNLQINQRAFDRAIDSAFARLNYFDVKASAFAVAIALLTLAGLMQRIREYS